jgi:hypothetical protein
VVRLAWIAIAAVAVAAGGGCNSILDFNHGTLSQGGLPCQTDTGHTSPDCDDGFVCMFKSCGKRCTADSECPSDSRCLNVFGGTNGACTRSSDATCDQGCPTNTTCVTAEDVCRTRCGIGLQTCLSDQACVNGLCYGSPPHDPGADAGSDASTSDAASDAVVDASSDTSDANADADASVECRSVAIPIGGGAVVTASGGVMPTGDATYEAWIKLDATKTSPVILADCTSGGNCDAALTVRDDTGEIRFAVQSGTTPIIASFTTNPHDSTWHHIAGTRKINGSQLVLTLFLDGMFRATAGGMASDVGAQTDLRLGSISYAATDGLGGLIDEVRVSNTALYTTAFTPEARFSKLGSTVLLFHFDETVGTSFADSSVNARNGTLLGTSSLTSPAVCH